MKGKIPKDVLDFFKGNASAISVRGETWYFYPYWVRVHGDEEQVEMVRFENLPDYVKVVIKSIAMPSTPPQHPIRTTLPRIEDYKP